MPPCCSFPNHGHRHLGLGQRARLGRRLAGPPGLPAVLWGGCGHGLRVSTRPWTRFGIIAFVGHLGYELAAGVAVPFAPHLGVRAGAAVSITPIAACYVPAGSRALEETGPSPSSTASSLPQWSRTTRAGPAPGT